MSSGIYRDSPDATCSSSDPSSAPSVLMRIAGCPSCGEWFSSPFIPPPNCRGEGDVPPCFGGGVPRNGLLPDDGTRDEVAHAESTASTMIVDVMRTDST